MSLIMGILQDDFCIMCADTQLNHFDGSKGIFSKVHYINPNTICATGGDVETICEYLSYAYTELQTKTFEQIDMLSVAYFETLYKSSPHIPNISLLLSGRINGDLYMRVFVILDEQITENSLYCCKDGIVRKLLGNAELHISAVSKNFQKRNTSVDEILIGFQEVLNEGIHLDDTINNILEYVVITR